MRFVGSWRYTAVLRSLTRCMPKPPAISPSAIHAARRDARRTLECLRTLRPALGRTAFARLRLSLRDFINITAESRDAEVQRGLIRRLTVASGKKRTTRRGQALWRELTSRRAVALAGLAAYQRSGAAAGQRQQEDLRQLRLAQSAVDLPQLAARRYRRALRALERLLTKRIPTGHRMHRLRIRMRRARDVATFYYPPPGRGANHVLHKLDRMQEALGDLHDYRLLTQWARERDIAIPRPLRRALDAQAQRRLRQLRRHRKPLLQAIRNFLEATHY